MVTITRGLAEVLVDMAAAAEPDPVSTGVSVRQASQLEGETAIPGSTPVFTEFYLPDPGNAVTHVFGVDLSTPARGAQGRFVSHPTGSLALSSRDDLAEVVFVAVPPWGLEEESFGAFDRTGARLELSIIEAEPPPDVLEE
ncbi:MAG: hypothetical protein U5K37_09295 [Natrialbaceae archaeon]|nr:hypothetical protein [Natrialbaceae archaeon]